MTLDLTQVTPDSIVKLSDDDFRQLLEKTLNLSKIDRQEMQLQYFKPTSIKAERIFLTDAKKICVGGGNGSGKTENALSYMAAMATGVLPLWQRDIFRKKFRGPINARVIQQSHTTTLHQVILPKLQWWKWTGVGQPGSDKGHWGWIPKTCLVDGQWDKSWSEKLRTLTVLCHDPDDHDKIIGESKIQFMAHSQEPEDFASGDFHFVLCDEPPSYAIWTENEARTMRAAGLMMLSMTWPDDPSIPVDWIFDKLYDPGRPGGRKDPNVEWIELDTTENPHLDQTSIHQQMADWSEEKKSVRIKGQPIRFSNLIHPLFTDIDHCWCFVCGKPVYFEEKDKKCPVCGNDDRTIYNHVRSLYSARGDNYPCVFVIDPHPRKPHMFMWVQVDPSDDYTVVAEGELAGEPIDVRRMVDEIEANRNLIVPVRLMDPNMGRSPAGINREVTWQDEFDDAGLMMELADDSSVGRGRVNEYLKPDRHTLQPRLTIADSCQQTIFQLKRYAWDEYKAKQERDLKQVPRDKYSDYPSLLKYLMNYLPSFRMLRGGGEVLQTRKRV